MVIFSVSPAFGRSSCTLSAIAYTILLPSIWKAIGSDRNPVNPSSRLGTKTRYSSSGGAHELNTYRANNRRQLIEPPDCQVALALLESAYVLVADPRRPRKLLLGQTLFLPDPLDVPRGGLVGAIQGYRFGRRPPRSGFGTGSPGAGTTKNSTIVEPRASASCSSNATVGVPGPVRGG